MVIYRRMIFISLTFIFLISHFYFVSSLESNSYNLTIDTNERVIWTTKVGWGSGAGGERFRWSYLGRSGSDDLLSSDNVRWNSITNTISNRYDLGYRRFHIHNPFGTIRGEEMMFDQWLEAHPRLYGDIFIDGVVDSLDQEMFDSSLGSKKYNLTKDDENYNKYADLDWDGDVDSLDQEMFEMTLGHKFDWENIRPLGDLNNDGVVDSLDQEMFELFSGYNDLYDLNNDKKVNNDDKIILEQNLGAKILPKDRNPIFGDFDGDGVVWSDDVQIINPLIGSTLGDSNYDPKYDLNFDEIINEQDVEIVNFNKGESIRQSGVVPLVIDFKKEWNEFFLEHSDTEITLYIGSPHVDENSLYLIEKGYIDKWWERVDLATSFADGFNFTIGLDNSAAGNEYTNELMEYLTNKGYKVVSEAKPTKVKVDNNPDFLDYDVLSLIRNFYSNNDPYSEKIDGVQGPHPNRKNIQYPNEVFNSEFRIWHQNIEDDLPLVGYYFSKGLTLMIDYPTKSPQEVIDQYYSFELPSIIELDYDHKNDNLNYLIVDNPKNGILNKYNASNSKLLYVPSGSFAGIDVFTYSISDNNTVSDSSTVLICYQNYNVDCETYYSDYYSKNSITPDVKNQTDEINEIDQDDLENDGIDEEEEITLESNSENKNSPLISEGIVSQNDSSNFKNEGLTFDTNLFDNSGLLIILFFDIVIIGFILYRYFFP